MSSSTSGYAGDRSVEDTWTALTDTPEALLVDVRTRAEWSFVGVPDLGPLGKEPILLEWQSYPSGVANPEFATALAAELASRGAGPETPVFFLCRSGVRSQRAAAALTAEGFGACYNILGGFEGPLDAEGHRGGAEGWKAAGLPWTQS
jgi:rhodanese-related sulfurtransferase